MAVPMAKVLPAWTDEKLREPLAAGRRGGDHVGDAR